MTHKQRLWYLPIVIVTLFIFTNSDEPEFEKNKCERIALKEIAESKDKIVQLKCDCPVLSWDTISRPENSEIKAQLLLNWRVINVKKLYYNK